MMDSDLAELYEVLTKNLNKAVKRNRESFPDDFMFQLTKAEYDSLRFQFGTLKRGQHSKFLPYVFTQLGVSMLSSVLRSKKAIAVNIQIMRVFNRMQELLLTHKDILLKLEALERKMMKQDSKIGKHDKEIQMIFTYLKKLLGTEKQERKRIGYKQYDEK